MFQSAWSWIWRLRLQQKWHALILKSPIRIILLFLLLLIIIRSDNQRSIPYLFGHGVDQPDVEVLLRSHSWTQTNIIQVCVIHVFLSVNILCSKTSAPTVTVEQLQFVMNPVVRFFSRRLLNTRKQTDGCVCFQHLFGSCDLCDDELHQAGDVVEM